MMLDIRDCYNKVVCKANALTGLVEICRSRLRTAFTLSVGQGVTIETEKDHHYVVTYVERISESEFKVESVDMTLSVGNV